MNKKFFIFVEDPGSLNMVIDLPEFFTDLNIPFDLAANNYASDLLKQKKIHHIRLQNIEDAKLFLQSKDYYIFLIGTSENKKSLGLDLIKLGNIRKIKTVGIVDMFINYSNRFKGESNCPLQFKPNFLLVTDDATKSAFIKLGFEKNNIFVCKHPQLERLRKLKSIFKKKFPIENKMKKRWLFVSENIDLLNPSESFRSNDYSFLGRGVSKWRTAIILEEVIEALKTYCPDIKLEVRLHPKNKIEQFDLWNKEVTFDQINDPLESVWKADFVLGMSSNLLVEAMLFEKNVLSILPRLKEKEWLYELKIGMIPSVFNSYELKNKIKDFVYNDSNLIQSHYLNEKRDSINKVLMTL